ncbi:glutamate racemase [Alkalilimnicola sp. S0819]|uniref:glutamate racemase n=1 Tax=Alkalilimnicola sp. S0819 TaxID=2613922 RepID=UPI001D00CB22|nr:glutamate racemase [Alkalilimnicola sp. S0819]
MGIFDSGVGGLSVMREIRRLLPGEHLLYIADSAYAPYGPRPVDFIRERAAGLTAFLAEQGAKAVVVACNTATAAAVGELRRSFSLPIIAMEPAVKPAAAVSRCGVLGVLATEGTLKSAQFAALLSRYARNLRVVTQSCHGLVEQVERGALAAEETRLLLRRYTAPLLAEGADTIILGCTHYPFLRPQLADLLGPTVALVDTGEAVARQLARRLDELALLSTRETGTCRFWSSGDTARLAPVMGRLWGEALALQPLRLSTALAVTP